MNSCGHLIFKTECPVCKELQAKWYQKLEEEKFEELESMQYGEDRPLKSWHSWCFQTIDPLEIEITQENNDRRWEFLHAFHFQSKLHKRIWELHCEGLSRYKIEIAVSRFKDAPKQSTIRYIIMDLEREIDQW